MKKKRKGVKNTAPKCPYCGSHTIFRSAEGIYHKNPEREMLYVCKNYPACDSYVRVHPGTNRPMGVPANQKLRAMRTEAHRNFNQIYYRNIMSKREAYEWLSEILGLPISKTHIGQMGEYYCQLVIDESKKLLNGEKHIRNLRNQKYRRLGECG